MKKVEFLLKQLIFHYENDLADKDEAFIKDIDVVREYFNLLIMSVTRYIHNFRYCDKVDCPCSPENDIKRVYNYLETYLKGTKTALYPIPYETIEEIIKGLTK